MASTATACLAGKSQGEIRKDTKDVKDRKR